jgi:hypothetical protein
LDEIFVNGDAIVDVLSGVEAAIIAREAIAEPVVEERAS